MPVAFILNPNCQTCVWLSWFGERIIAQPFTIRMDLKLVPTQTTLNYFLDISLWSLHWTARYYFLLFSMQSTSTTLQLEDPDLPPVDPYDPVKITSTLRRSRSSNRLNHYVRGVKVGKGKYGDVYICREMNPGMGRYTMVSLLSILPLNNMASDSRIPARPSRVSERSTCSATKSRCCERLISRVRELEIKSNHFQTVRWIAFVKKLPLWRNVDTRIWFVCLRS